MSIYYVQIEDGMVVDRIVADEPLPPDFFPPGEEWMEDDEAQIGWSYDGTTFTAPPPLPIPPPTGEDIRRQLLLALVPVAELQTLLATADGPDIDAWADDNANSLPQLRTAFRTLLKLLAARL